MAGLGVVDDLDAAGANSGVFTPRPKTHWPSLTADVDGEGKRPSARPLGPQAVGMELWYETHRKCSESTAQNLTVT